MNIWNQKWENLTLVNDFIFMKTFSRNDYFKYFLEKLLNTKLVNFSTPQKEKVIDEFFRLRAIRLDIFAEEKNGRMFNLEMQTTNKRKDCLPKRAFYQQAMITVNSYMKGQDPINIRDSYVIFICTFDPFHYNYAVYNFSYMCSFNQSLLMNEGKNIIYLNIKGKNNGLNEEIYDLLLYMKGNEPKTSFVKTIANEVSSIKNDSKLREEYMFLSNALDDALYEGEQRGIKNTILRNLSNRFGKDKIVGIKNILYKINGVNNLNLLFDYSSLVESPSAFIAKIKGLKLTEKK